MHIQSYFLYYLAQHKNALLWKQSIYGKNLGFDALFIEMLNLREIHKGRFWVLRGQTAAEKSYLHEDSYGCRTYERKMDVALAWI